MRNPQCAGRKNAGIALVVTLIILVLLAAMAVALLQTSSLERGTSKAVADKAKADLIAQTAVNAAIARLVDNITTYPDSATTWETINGDPGTVIYYRTGTPEQGAGSPMNVLPLISGATSQTVANKGNSLGGSALDDQNSYDLNHARFSGDTHGWIGAPPGAAGRPSYRGLWINLTDSDSKVTGRYAYWMEDESFKANANYMGSTPRGSSTLGDNPNQVPFQGILKAVLAGNPDSITLNTVAASVTSYRGQFPSSFFYNFRDINQVSGESTLADNAKFEATIFSGTSNLSRSGTKRVDLNKVVFSSTDPVEIRKQLDEIINSITYHLPNFAQRFYRTGTDKNSLDVPSTGTPSHQTIYLNKVAANIRDYIDTDSQPTIVNNDSGLTINIGAAPTHSLPGGGASGTNEVIAIGKEAVPMMQEYMLRVKQDVFSNRLGTSATYKLEIDHYIEVWNLTDKDITVASLGPNPFLRIANQFGWDAGGATDIPESPSRDFSIPLNVFTNSGGAQLSFPAGTATVLTTDPTPLPSTFPGVDASRVFHPPAGTPADSYRVYQGVTQKKSGSNLRIDSIPRPVNSSNAADLETELIIGNDNGVLESFGAPAVYYITANVDDGSSNADSTRSDITQYYFRASSLKGNALGATPSQVGDPRTNNEQLSVTTSTANDDQTPYKLEAWNSPSQIPNTTFTALNSNYVNPTLWTDYAKNVADAAHAPAVIANGPLTSIGQLGDVFDPVRSIGVSGNILYSRGGGRTLKIGQPDDLWDGNSNSASREWTAWRLTDVFATTDAVQLDGRININGVNRDGGAAFKTALYGYNFEVSPDSDPTIVTILIR
jgi:type II secretory pathway pseudopilin PulG